MHQQHRGFKLAALAVCLGASSPAVLAQAFDVVRLFGAAPGESGGTVGLAVIAGKAYQGSDERRTRVLPGIDYQWSNGWFAGTSNGIGYNFSGDRSMKYGVRLTADFGRDEKRSDALRGMGDIDAKPEIGGFFNWYLTREFFLTSSLRYGSGNDADGLIVDLGAGYTTELTQSWRLAVGGALTLLNDKGMQSAFGVSATQSGSSGYAVYEPGGGLRDARAGLALTHLFSPRTSITAAVNVSSLQGDAGDSPLTRSKTSTTGVLVASYSF